MRRVLRIVVIALLVIAIGASGALATGLVVTREPAPRPLNADRIEAASKPAIVLVQSNYVVHTSLPTFAITGAKRQALINKLIGLVEAGQLDPSDDAAVERAAVNVVLANPDAYYSEGPPTHDQFDIVSTGTGFFVTEDGYLVTAAHVVSANKAEILAETLSASKDPAQLVQLRQDIRDGFTRDTGISISDSQVDRFESFMLRWLDRYLQVDSVDVKYYLGTGTVETGDRLVGTGTRASVVSIDPTSTGHDIAIMKADVTGVPTLQLATGSPEFGEVTYPLGYARTGYLQEEAPFDQTIAPTMTVGKVADTQTQSTGWTAWGTAAQFTHGDSGGPVIDGDGKVIGVISYVVVDSQGKQLLGQGYFVPTQYVREDLASKSINPVNDATGLTATYYRALADGDIHYYKPELILLEQIQSRSSWNAYVKDDIVSVQSQVLAGNDKTPPDLYPFVLPGVGSSGAVGALAILVWIGLGVTGRRKPVPAAATQAAEVAAVPASAEGPTEAVPAPADRPAPAAAPTYSEPSIEVVSTPQAVLRESETIAPASPATPQSPSEAS